MTGLSNPTFRCSAVIPEGPPAHPFLAVLKLCKNLSTSRSNGTSGSKSAIAGSNSDLGLLGLRASSVRILLVASLPGATGEDSNTCRADDNSPTWVKWKGFAVLHSMIVFAATPLPCSRRDPTHRVLK